MAEIIEWHVDYDGTVFTARCVRDNGTSDTIALKFDGRPNDSIADRCATQAHHGILVTITPEAQAASERMP